MKASYAYRAAAVILLLFAIGHTFSFSLTDPQWGLDNMLGQMRTIRFAIGGIERTYWDFFIASGLTVGLLYLFSAVLAWQLGSVRPETLSELRLVTWAFPLAFAAVFVVASIHLFLIPQMFSIAVTICLTAAAWLART
jgi:hypothetical protein